MKKVDINKAHEELMIELFGIPSLPDTNVKIAREKYTKAMEKVQKKYGLRQGHPDFLAWVFTCVGRSPIIIEDGEDHRVKGAGEHE